MMRYTMVLAAAALLGTATACTDDDPIEVQMGSASAVITDDPSTASASARAGHTQADQAGPFSGTFSSDARVSIRAEGGMWVDLGSLADATVSLQSSSDATTIHANAAVPVGTYTQVRLTLSGAEARVAAGAVLGGLTVTSDVHIRVGSDGRLAIEKTVEPFLIDSDAHVRILFDLNSEAWIHGQSVEEEAADDGEVRDHTTATRTVAFQE